MFPRQKLHQSLKFSLPLHGSVDVRLGLDVPPRHSGHLNLLAAGQQHYSRTSHERRDVLKPVDGAGTRVIAEVVFELFGALNRPNRAVLQPLLI